MGKRRPSLSGHTWHASLLPGGIQARLFLLISLTLLPVLVLLGWIYYQRHETRHAQTLAAELEVAQGVAATFESYVGDVRRQNYSVGLGIITFERYTEAKATTVLTGAARQYRSVRNMSWVSPEGRVLASSEPAMIGTDLSQRPYIQEILAGAAWAIGDLTPRGAVTKAPTFAIATALRDNQGVLRGVVATGIEPDRLGEITLTLQRPAGAAYAIFDRQGTLVFRSLGEAQSWEQRRRWIETDPLLRRALETGQPQAGQVYLEIPKGEWLSARAPITGIGWVAGAGRFTATAMAPMRRLLVQDVLLAFAVFTGAFVLATQIARSIAWPLRQLKDDALRAGSGKNLAPREDPRAPAEVRELRTTVTAMAARLIERAEALRTSEERYRLINHATHDVIRDWDLTSDELFWNEAVETTFGYSPRELPPTIAWWYEQIHPADRERVVGAIQAVIDQPHENLWNAEYRFRHRDGHWVDVLDRGMVARDAQGRGVRMIGSMQDLTERKRAEAELARNRTMLAEAEKLAHTGAWEWDLSADRWSFSDEWLAIHGCGNRTMTSEELLTLAHPEDSPEIERAFKSVRSGSAPYELEHRIMRQDNGEVRRVRAHGQFVRDEAGQVVSVYGFVQDITEQWAAEAALRASEVRLRSAFSIATVGVLFFRLDGHLWEANAAFERMSGYTTEELRQITHWEQLTPPEFLEATAQTAERLATRGKTPPYEKQMIRKDGSRWWGLFAPTRLAGSGRDSECVEFIIDITESKQAEEALRTANAALAEADRRKDEFLAMLAHELRNPLAPVRNAVQILNLAGAQEPMLRRQRDIIDRQVTHMARLLDDLLDVSRITRGKINLKRDSVRLMDVLARAVETAMPLIEAHSHTLSMEVHSRDEMIVGDFDRLIQIVGNLLTNAAKYTENGGRIWLESAREDKTIVIRVRDTGVGIAPDLLPKVFDVFTQAERSLDRSQGGLGLGLTLVRSLTQLHGGSVEAHSEGPGRGSEFIIRLPGYLHAGDERLLERMARSIRSSPA